MNNGERRRKYKLKKKIVSEITLTLLLLSMLTLAFNIQLVKSEPKTWTVDDDGPADFHTIQEAINAANPGDTVYVKSGTYYEHVVVNKTVRLKGVYDANFIDGNRRPGTVVTITADNVVVYGFTILNSGSQSEDAGIRLDNSDGTIVGWNTLINNSIGISLVDSDNNTLEGNDIYYCEYCNIDLINSHNNTIEYNYMRKLGIQLWESNSNTLHSNKVFEAEYGISLRGNHNNITGNQLESNAIGINLQGNCNVIAGNILRSSIQLGIMLSGSDNVIYHNNFVNNAKQVWTNSSNSWDDGYPSGGNYWSDHPSADWYSGPTQDILGSDGIDDMPYVIDTYNRDSYPFMMWPPPKIVVSFYPPTSTVMPNETFTVNITVANISIDEVVNGLYGWDFELEFNSKILHVVNATEGPFLKTAFNETTWGENLGPPKIDNDAGTITQGNTHLPIYPMPTSGATGNGTLATVTFKALSIGATSLHFNFVKLYSVYMKYVITYGDFSPVFNADGIVTVIGSPFIHATLDIVPKALNWQSKGKWVACCIELPEGFDVGDVDASTILLNDVILAETSEICGKRLKASFDRSSVIALLPQVGEVELTVIGVLFEGTPFEGSDTIRTK